MFQKMLYSLCSSCERMISRFASRDFVHRFLSTQSSNHRLRKLSLRQSLLSAVRTVSSEQLDGSSDIQLYDVESSVQQLLNDAQISTANPHESDDVNLDESGSFLESTSPNLFDNLTESTRARVKKQVDYASKSVYLFPGTLMLLQPGFVKGVMNVQSVRDLFEEADEIVGYKLSDICVNGPKELLNETRFSQLAVLVSSLAEMEWLRVHKPFVHDNLIMAGGFDVGEITSLVAVGALTFPQAVGLVKARGEAMHEAASMDEGGLVFVEGGRKTNFTELCTTMASFGDLSGLKDPVCSVAAHVFQCSKIIGGHMRCLKHIHSLKKDFHIRTVRPLSSIGGFNTPLMSAAMELYAEALDKIVFCDPKTWTASVYSNVSGSRFKKWEFESNNGKEVKAMLWRQLRSPIKWETIANRLATKGNSDDYPSFYELGNGDFLSRSLRKINNKAASRCKNLKSFIDLIEK